MAAKKMVFHHFPDYKIYRSWLPFSPVGVIGDASGSLHPHLHSYFSTISFQQHAGFRLDLAGFRLDFFLRKGKPQYQMRKKEDRNTFFKSNLDGLG